MRRYLLALGLMLSSTSAMALSCGQPELFSENSYPVIFRGEILDVKLGEQGEGTYWGVLEFVVELFLSEPPRFNTAKVRVDSVLRGNVRNGDTVEVTAPLDVGPRRMLSHGLRFKEGGVLMVASRNKRGELVTDGFDCPKIPAGKPIARLEEIARLVAEIGDPAHPGALPIDDALKMDEFLKEGWDGERRAALWRHFIKKDDRHEYRARMAESLFMSRQYAEARDEATRAAEAGSEEAKKTLALARVRLGEKADYTLLPISGQEFRKLDLSGANLSGKDMSRALVTDLIATGTNLARANLSSARVISAKLDGADLQGADLTKASISAYAEKGATFAGAKVSGMGLSFFESDGVDMSGIAGDGALFRQDFSGANFRGAVLTGESDFDYIDLRKADFGGAVLAGASFSRGKLHGADLSTANLAGTSWKSMTYDCETKFPSGFAPEEHGMARFQVCADGKEPDLSKTTLEMCEEECQDWLMAKPGRTVRVEADGGLERIGPYILSLMKSDVKCSQSQESGLTLRVNAKDGSDGRKALKNGFCPVIRLEGANPPERLFEVGGLASYSDMSTTPPISLPRSAVITGPKMKGRSSISVTQQDDGYMRSPEFRIERDLQQLQYLDEKTQREVVLPIIRRLMESDSQYRLKVLSGSAGVLKVLGEYDLVLNGMLEKFGTGDELRWLGIGSTWPDGFRERVLRLIKQSPELVSRPAFEGFVDEMTSGRHKERLSPWCGQNPYDPIFCKPRIKPPLPAPPAR